MKVYFFFLIKLYKEPVIKKKKLFSVDSLRKKIMDKKS